MARNDQWNGQGQRTAAAPETDAERAARIAATMEVVIESSPELEKALETPATGEIVAGFVPPVVPPPGAPLTATPAPEPSRRDQFKCPKCGAFGCPRTGSSPTRHGTTRYRKCSSPKCLHSFQTFEQWAPGSASAGCGVETVKR